MCHTKLDYVINTTSRQGHNSYCSVNTSLSPSSHNMPNSPHPSSISHHHLHCERDERPPSPPTQTFHPSFLPKPSEFSVFGGAHYSGAKVVHRKSDIRRASFGDGHVIAELSERRKRLIDDLYEVRGLSVSSGCEEFANFAQRLSDEIAVFLSPVIGNYRAGLEKGCYV